MEIFLKLNCRNYKRIIQKKLSIILYLKNGQKTTKISKMTRFLLERENLVFEIHKNKKVLYVFENNTPLLSDVTNDSRPSSLFTFLIKRLRWIESDFQNRNWFSESKLIWMGILHSNVKYSHSRQTNYRTVTFNLRLIAFIFLLAYLRNYRHFLLFLLLNRNNRETSFQILLHLCPQDV